MKKTEAMRQALAIALMGIAFGIGILLESFIGEEKTDDWMDWFGESRIGTWIENSLPG